MCPSDISRTLCMSLGGASKHKDCRGFQSSVFPMFGLAIWMFFYPHSWLAGAFQ
ncbi:hypothetical protein XENTR_v10007025 [Xenopus tropicalis]|nr:hypothetical protein XENTR_v10007025 [Xenopus tropicalis]